MNSALVWFQGRQGESPCKLQLLVNNSCGMNIVGQLHDGRITNTILRYTQYFLHFQKNRNIVRKLLVIPLLFPWSMLFLKMLVYIDDTSCVGGTTHQDKWSDYQWYNLITMSILLSFQAVHYARYFYPLTILCCTD